MGLSEIVIRVLCIGSVVLYAASASLISNPQVHLSPAIVEKLLQTEGTSTSLFIPTTVEDQFLIHNFSSRVNGLESFFRTVGAPLQPITLTVDKDHPLRVSIGSTDIVLGREASLSKGQLEHALIKAWIRQVGSSEVLNNPLRAEVYADLLLAVYAGKLDLQDPDSRNSAQFEEVVNWNNDLLGTLQLCDSPWRPAEIILYCKGLQSASNNSQTSYSLRSVVGSLIWQDLKKLGLLERRHALTEISRNLRSQKITEASLVSKKETEEILDMDHLQSAIETEAKRIYPDLVSSLPRATPTIGLLKSGKLSMAGGFEIRSVSVHKFKKLIFESCESPSISQLLKTTSDATEHILFVKNCDKKLVNYSGFAKSGIAKFALDNRSIKFTYLHRESLKLANKMIHNLDIQSLLEADLTETKDAKFLGLDQKIFRDDVGAFKVNGPIGAIEWYRTDSISVSESHS